MDLDMTGTAHTTFKREDVEGGEPDESFYFSNNAERVRGKEDIDLDAGDPPPDLVVEVDLTSPLLSAPNKTSRQVTGYPCILS